MTDELIHYTDGTPSREWEEQPTCKEHLQVPRSWLESKRKVWPHNDIKSEQTNLITQEHNNLIDEILKEFG